MMRIAIFCGGPSSEHEVSLSSAQSILDNIDRKKYQPFVFFIKKDLKSSFYKVNEDITSPADIPFNDFELVLKETKDKFDIALLAALHGEFGEDGSIQLIFENLGITYTGSDSKASKLCMDKYASMEKVKNINGINIPITVYLSIQDLTKKAPMDFPFIIKPNSLGSSVLTFIINNQKEYEKAIDEIKKGEVNKVLIQELIEGIEIQCACLETSRGKFIVLPPIEIKPSSDFFDYNSKYNVGGAEEITPPISITKRESDRISNLTAKIHKLLECRTYSRSDFMYKDGKIYYLETNTLPGMTKTSLLPQEAQAADISFAKLIDFIITEHK